jgi:hypothetical protein
MAKVSLTFLQAPESLAKVVGNLELLESETGGQPQEFSRVPCIGEELVIGSCIYKVEKVYHRISGDSSSFGDAEIQVRLFNLN